MKPSKIIQITSLVIFPFVLLFSFYLISHGHLSPGGGFQGGVVLGTALILLVLTEGLETSEKSFSSRLLNILKNGGLLAFLFLGLLGIWLGGNFLTDFLPLGSAGTLFSGGAVLLLNIIIGVMVGAEVALLFYAMVKYRRHH